MRLADTIGRWLGRVEVVLAGADDSFRTGELALAQGDAMGARAAARDVLDRVPGSPLGLALLADACELASLDAELALTLEELASKVGSQADVWVRLGRARQATGAPIADVRDAYVRALAVAESGSEARKEALLGLADLDLAQRDGARAELWLDRVASDKEPAIVLRRAEARLARGDAPGAQGWLDKLGDSPADARAALARGRAFAMASDPRAFGSLVRAVLLDAPGASEALSSSLAWIPTDDATRARVHLIVDAKEETRLARWRAAFARAEGKRDEARAALRDAVLGGDASAARPLLDAALEDQDHRALATALEALPPEARSGATARDARRIPPPSEVEDPEHARAVLDTMALVASERVRPWADAIVKQLVLRWVPPTGAPSEWSPVLARLDAHARALHDLDATASLASLSAERARPVRLAIVGEFNAGKSTFINALMGADIAPTGVLPTTATLHHLRYGPDPIARVLFEVAPGGAASGDAPPERIVPVSELRATLKAVASAPIRRVEILLPIASLTRVEILDTPGFNAPDARHAETARAAFDEADAAIWLFDAGQALKQTEREILDEARASKLPIQILVNKADRLAAADLAKVMDLVNRSLGEIGLASWSPPLALSARLALAGRLGDAAALEASGWPRVQELLEGQIIARSAELKERALRRRAGIIVTRLGARAAQLARDESDAASARARRAQALSLAAATLDRELDDIATELARALEPSARAYGHDLEVVVTGRDADANERDPSLQRYRVERSLARIAPALAEELAASARGVDLAPAELSPLARAVVRAYAAHPGPLALGPLARAAIATLVDHLGLLASSAEADVGFRAAPATLPASGLVRELAALAEVLARPSTSPCA